MTATESIDLTEHRELTATLVGDLFQTMLASEAWPDDDQSPDHCYNVCGALFCAGPWQGAVLLELDKPLAFAIAKQLEGIPEPTEVDRYVRDSVGEVTNMLAGNLKSLLPAGTLMSIPSVVEGSDFSIDVVGESRTSRVGFGSPNGGFRITLIETRQ